MGIQMAQRLELDALPEEPDLIPAPKGNSKPSVSSVPGDLMPSPASMQLHVHDTKTKMQAKDLHMN